MRGAPLGLLGLLVLGAGCSSSDATVVPASRWGSTYAEAECARIFSCCDAAERATYTDEAQCRHDLADQAQTSLDSVLSVGWVTYDAKAARRCVDEVATLACPELVVIGKVLIGPSCDGITRGTGKIGAACEDLDVICESSNCEPGTGTCGPTRGCTVVCAADEFCDTTAQACAPLKAAGAACAGDAECAFPLTCQSSGLCAAPQPGGAACLSGSDCASTDCVDGVCAAMACDGV